MMPVVDDVRIPLSFKQVSRVTRRIRSFLADACYPGLTRFTLVSDNAADDRPCLVVMDRYQPTYTRSTIDVVFRPIERGDNDEQRHHAEIIKCARTIAALSRHTVCECRATPGVGVRLTWYTIGVEGGDAGERADLDFGAALASPQFALLLRLLAVHEWGRRHHIVAHTLRARPQRDATLRLDYISSISEAGFRALYPPALSNDNITVAQTE